MTFFMSNDVEKSGTGKKRWKGTARIASLKLLSEYFIPGENIDMCSESRHKIYDCLIAKDNVLKNCFSGCCVMSLNTKIP